MSACPAICPPMERTRHGHLPRNPPTPREREAHWRIKWAGLTVEQTLHPIEAPRAANTAQEQGSKQQ